MSERGNIDSVRASRAGHRFHEAWTARCALGLVFPQDGLTAIAVEGLSVEESKGGRPGAEVADLTLYYGDGAEFELAERCEVLQFKYSEVHARDAVTATDLNKTVGKFAALFLSYVADHGYEMVRERLVFGYVTNRPASDKLIEALKALRSGAEPSPAAKRTAQSLLAAAKLPNEQAAEFFSLVSVQAGESCLSVLDQSVQHLIADWSPGRDYVATARMGALRELVSKKAELAGSKDNLIRQANVLAALQVNDPKRLLPAEAAFPDPGEILERAETRAVIDHVINESAPLILHAAGGVGKTVFLQALAANLAHTHEVIHFDCFAGGAYRSPEDERHLPRVGLMHVINELAFRGLCDPILPGGGDTRELLVSARTRLEQAATTLRRAGRGGLVLLLDAADNAARQADDRRQDAFPTKLLEALCRRPVEGVSLIASCRTHRIDDARGASDPKLIALRPFDRTMSDVYVRARVPDATDTQLASVFARSKGNARVLAYFVENWRTLITETRPSAPVLVEELIQRRVNDAIKAAEERGAHREEISAFLAGLALLPPPIPVDEFADALGWSRTAVEDSTTDLAPLLDQTKHGLIFRDEPTETYVRETYGGSGEAVREIADRLRNAQERSIYAAYSLPRLLVVLRDAEAAHQLALTTALPAVAMSEVGQRRIRFVRLRAALQLASDAEDADKLVGILAELGSLEAVNARGDEYLAASPELVALAGDTDCVRRLFEDEAGWQGARSARLALFHSMSGDTEEAAHHVRMLNQWIEWYYIDNEEEFEGADRPEQREIASIPFYLILAGRPDQAIAYFGHWNAVYAFGIAKRLADYLSVVDEARGSKHLVVFAQALSRAKRLSPFVCTPILERLRPRGTVFKALLKRAGRALEKIPSLRAFPDYQPREELRDSLVGVGFAGFVSGERELGIKFVRAADFRRPSEREYGSDPYRRQFPRLLLAACMRAIAAGRSVRRADLVPEKMSRLKGVLSAASRAELKKALDAYAEKKRKEERRKDHSSHRLSDVLSQSEIEAICTVVEVLLPFAQQMEKWVARGHANLTDVKKIRSLWSKPERDISLRYSDHEIRLTRNSLARACFAWSFKCVARPSARYADVYIGALKDASQTLAVGAEAVALLASRSVWHEAAGIQAQTVAGAICELDWVDQRAAECSSLARAILNADPASSREYFRLGLRQLDAIGAGDFDAVYGLLGLAARQRGGDIDPRLSQRLMTHCEINFSDEPHKFSWGFFARCAAASVGENAFARAARWADRDIAPLDYTIGPLAAEFAATGRLEPLRASILLHLVDPDSWHDYSAADMLERVLSKADPTQAREILHRSVVIFRRKQGDEGWPSLWERLIELFEPFDQPEMKKLKRELSKLLAVAEQRSSERNFRQNYHSGTGVLSDERKREMAAEKKAAQSEIQALVRRTDPLSAATLDEAFAQIEKSRRGRDEQHLLLTGLKEKVAVRDRKVFLEALAANRVVDGYFLLSALKECLDDWDDRAAFVAGERLELARGIINSRAGEFLGGAWEAAYKLKKIAELGGVPPQSLILDVVKAVAKEEIHVSSRNWFYLAAELCDLADGASAREALEHQLVGVAAELADEATEGPFGDEFVAPTDQADLCAGLIWRCLGDVDAYNRWQAAHAVRSLAALGLEDDLRALCALSVSSTAGAFGASDRKFNYLNARQWLLIGLSRAALDNPEQVQCCRATLLEACFSENTHAIMRAIAARGLRALELASDYPDEALLRRLEAINKSPFGYAPAANEKYSHAWPMRTQGFVFEYEFSKYGPSSMGRVFGLSREEAEEAIVSEVRRLDPLLERMDDTGGKAIPSGRRDRSESERFEPYGEHIVRHAMLRAATRLLQEKPVLASDHYCRWTDWLERYDLSWNDGYWLADGTDLPPAVVHQRALEFVEGKETPFSDAGKYAELIGLAPERAHGEVPLYGYWQSEDGCSIHVESALIAARGAISRCQELSRQSYYDVWLPMADSNPGYYAKSERFTVFQPWIFTEDPWKGIDELDPFAAKTARKRPRLADEFIVELGLVPEDQFERVWRGKRNRTILRTYAWARALSEERRASTLLTANRAWLHSFLDAKKLKLVHLIGVSRFRSSEYGRTQSGEDIRTAVLSLMNADGELRYWGVKPPPPDGQLD